MLFDWNVKRLIVCFVDHSRLELDLFQNRLLAQRADDEHRTNAALDEAALLSGQIVIDCAIAEKQGRRPRHRLRPAL